MTIKEDKRKLIPARRKTTKLRKILPLTPNLLVKFVRHSTSKCWFSGKPRCHHYKKFGHIEKFYSFKANNQANFAGNKDAEEGKLFFAWHSSIKEEDKIWHLDSGCSYHISGNERRFLDMETSVTSKVYMGYGTIAIAKEEVFLYRQRKGKKKMFVIFFLSLIWNNRQLKMVAALSMMITGTKSCDC